MIMSNREGADAVVKVKFIVTKFVETEAADFKSVVQNLTGKNSKIADEEAEKNNKASGKRPKETTGGDDRQSKMRSLEMEAFEKRAFMGFLPSPEFLNDVYLSAI